MLKIKHINLFILLWVMALAGCKNNQTNEENKKPTVVATTGMIGDLVKNLVGDKMEVISLMGPGVDPHLYKATQGDLLLLDNADIVLYNGLKLEGKMGEILEKVGQKKPVVAVAKEIDDVLLLSDPGYPDDESAKDPHVWFDVSLWKRIIPVVTNILAEYDNENEDFFRSNALQYTKELEDLHDWAGQQIGLIPEDRRILVTSHDAFGYLAKAYHIEVDALQGISTVSEFGLKDISDLVNNIVERKIPAVFIESSVSPKSLEAVVEGCEDKGHEVKIGGTLYSDAMGEAGTEEGTYIGMVKHNVNTIVNALK